LTTWSFLHDNFSSVYWICNKLGHMIPLWKGKNPIYFGVITIIPFDNLYRRAYFVMHTFLVFIGNDRVSGVLKAAKNNQNCTSSKLSITTRLQWKLYCIYITITGPWNRFLLVFRMWHFLTCPWLFVNKQGLTSVNI
jgi:hypothetical protein